MIIPKEKTEQYQKYLSVCAALSNLFSANAQLPFLHYRTAELIFCQVLGAENLARQDTSYDAKINQIGIGIKTFVLGSVKSNFQKVAEFNKRGSDIHKISDIEKKTHFIASLRNERIRFANRLYGVKSALYHCIARDRKKIILFDNPYTEINTEKIKILHEKQSTSIAFEDGAAHYKFHYTKSTLYQSFSPRDDQLAFPVKILEDPLKFLLESVPSTIFEKEYTEEFVILPLYSTKRLEKYVPTNSGLNQWNAGGRKRKFGEVYIPIGAAVHKNNPEFFPKRDEIFDLHVPDGQVLRAKICQDNNKALMTNPNDALANWLLRSTLGLKEGERLTYEKLQDIGVDSVKIIKKSISSYAIQFHSQE